MVYRRILSKVLQGLIFSLILLTHLAQARTLKEIQVELEHSLRMDWATGQSNSTALLREWAQAIIQTPDWETQPETQTVIDRMKPFQLEKLTAEKTQTFRENGLFFELAATAFKVVNHAKAFKPEMIQAIVRGLQSTDYHGAQDAKNSDGLSVLIEKLEGLLDFSKPESITDFLETSNSKLFWSLAMGLENSAYSQPRNSEEKGIHANRKIVLDCILSNWIEKSNLLPQKTRERLFQLTIVPMMYLAGSSDEYISHFAYHRYVALQVSNEDLLELDSFREFFGKDFIRITAIGVESGIGLVDTNQTLSDAQKSYLNSIVRLLQSNNLQSQEILLVALAQTPQVALDYILAKVGVQFIKDLSIGIRKSEKKSIGVHEILEVWLGLSRHSKAFAPTLTENDFNWIATNITFLLAKATQIPNEAERKAASRELRICISLLASLAQHENLDPSANEIFQEGLNILTRAKMDTDNLTARQISEFILQALTHRPEVVFKSMTPALILEVDAVLKEPKNEELRKQVSDWLIRHPETVLSNMRTQVQSEIVKEVALHLLTGVTAQSYANRCAKIFNTAF